MTTTKLDEFEQQRMFAFAYIAGRVVRFTCERYLKGSVPDALLNEALCSLLAALARAAEEGTDLDLLPELIAIVDKFQAEEFDALIDGSAAAIDAVTLVGSVES